jgi:AbrB family looped-hinge helix DNA binding protein
MPSSTLTSKGQTTIPKEIRSRLRLKPGDRLEFVVDDAGRVLVIPGTVDVGALKGVLPRPRRRVSLEEMDGAIREGATRRVRRGE